jgi:UPF0755 protein
MSTDSKSPPSRKRPQRPLKAEARSAPKKPARKPPKKPARWRIVLVAVLLLAVLGGASAWLGYDALMNLRTEEKGGPAVVVIPKGAGLSSIANILHQAGVIEHPRLFMLASRLKKVSGGIKAGEYAIRPGTSQAEILNILGRGRVLTHTVSIPEGFNLKQIIARLAAMRLVDGQKAWALAHTPSYLRQKDIPAASLEGYLFPTTYRFARGLGARAVFNTMIKHFNKTWKPLEGRASNRKLSRHQLITLASIIEKEARHDHERPLISSVYHNRLKRGMLLQADPTVIYGVKDFDGNLTRAHLTEDTPYNTYVRKGLPPGPICSPGAKSLAAAVNPVESKKLYFVAMGDGRHYFSRTLREHKRAVYRYQIKPRRKKKK